MRINYIAETQLPTQWGIFQLFAFAEIETGHEHIALTIGSIKSAAEPVLSRIHSECLTGDALFSLRCDCGFQLKAALAAIAEVGQGILIYHRQEGRNIGLLNKIRAYALQDKGLDTVEANHRLGFSSDARDFTSCADIYTWFGIKSVKLLTNNPQKVLILKYLGIDVVETVPLIVGKNPHNESYLNSKKKKLGHLLPE